MTVVNQNSRLSPPTGFGRAMGERNYSYRNAQPQGNERTLQTADGQ